jgi:curli biogenesis system outer membrane secretion channel CsgG
MRIATNLRTVTKRTSRVIAALTVATTLIGCSSSGRSAGGMSANGASAGGTSARGRAAGQLSIRASDLASALDLVPDMADGYAMYTDRSMLGHQDRTDADTASFAGGAAPRR